MLSVLSIGGMRIALSQDQPAPKKDTVNIDTQAKPTFYYAEDEKQKSKGGIPVVAIIAGVAVVGGAGAFFMLRKKKA